VCSAFGHAPAATARTERATLARERDESVQAAAAAVKAREPARQEPAPEELPKGPLDELRQAVAVAQTGSLGEQGLEVILHDPRGVRFRRDGVVRSS